MRAVAILLLATLSACATPQTKVEVKGDTYCDIAEKIRWSTADTAETIKQVVRENAKHDRVCGARTS